MRITGTSSTIHFDLENGYSITGTGETLVDNKFAVDTSSLTSWDAPNDKKPFNRKDLLNIKKQVFEQMSSDTIQIIFD